MIKNHYPNPLTSWEASWKQHQTIQREEQARSLSGQLEVAARDLAENKRLDSNRHKFNSPEIINNLYRKIGLLSKTEEEADLDLLCFAVSKLIELCFAYPEATEPYQVSSLMEALRKCAEKTTDSEKRAIRARLYAEHAGEIGEGKIPGLSLWIAMKETKERMDKLLSQNHDK